jgi:hypothetical protein
MYSQHFEFITKEIIYFLVGESTLIWHGIQGFSSVTSSEQRKVLLEMAEIDTFGICKNRILIRDPYTDSNCEDGICMFTRYVSNGGAAITSSRQNDGDHLMIQDCQESKPARRRL